MPAAETDGDDDDGSDGSDDDDDDSRNAGRRGEKCGGSDESGAPSGDGSAGDGVLMSSPPEPEPAPAPWPAATPVKPDRLGERVVSMERIERMGTSFDARFFSTVQVPHTHSELGSAISSDVAHAGCSARRHAAQK